MLSVDAVVAGLGDKDRTHGSRNGLDDDAVAVDNEGMRGGYELPTRPAIETVKQLVDLRAVEAQWREPFMEEAEGRRKVPERRNGHLTKGTVPIVSFYTCIVKLFSLGEVGGGAGNIVGGSRRELFEKGDELQTDLVAEDVRLEVGGIGDVVLTDGIEVLEDVVTADAEQGTDDVFIMGTDARESVNTGTTEKVHQEGLDGIVTMMGHTDGLGPNILQQLTKIAVAEFARRHLNAYLMKGSVFDCFKVY